MIKTIENVLNNDECLEIIQEAKKYLTKMNVLGAKNDNYRVANGTWINQPDYLIQKIRNLIIKETGLPIENQEGFHVVNYEIGGEYKTHHDFFHPNTNYFESQISRGGQRAYSCLIYLNDNFTGGETDFPKKDIKISPQTGKMVIWSNIENGKLDHDSLHAGLPVITGEKWISVIWVRENKFK